MTLSLEPAVRPAEKLFGQRFTHRVMDEDACDQPRTGASAAVERYGLKRPPPPVADVPPPGVPRMVVAKAPAGGGVSPSNVASMSS